MILFLAQTFVKKCRKFNDKAWILEISAQITNNKIQTGVNFNDQEFSALRLNFEVSMEVNRNYRDTSLTGFMVKPESPKYFEREQNSHVSEIVLGSWYWRKSQDACFQDVFPFLYIFS